MEKIYIVTGAAGHLGSTIVEKLVANGCNVRSLVLKSEKHIPNGSEIYYGDICDKESLKPLFDNPTNAELYVIHAAGIVSIKGAYDEKVYNVNVNGTKNIADLCLENDVKRMVYTSSVHAIPELDKGEVIKEVNDFNPDLVKGLYAKTKAEATAYVLSLVSQGLNAIVVHPSGIIGPNDYANNHIVALIRDYYNHDLTAAIKGGYDFVDVRDVALGTISALNKGQVGECYILSNHYYTVKELLTICHEVTNKKEIKVYLPIWFIKLVAPIAEYYYRLKKTPPLFTAYSIYTLQSNANFSNEKARNELDYTTRDMRETIVDTVGYLKAKKLLKEKRP